MRKSICFFLCWVLFSIVAVQGKNIDVPMKIIEGQVLQCQVSFPDSLNLSAKDTIHHKKHRLVAALLAFPLGVFGLHRMYLGTSGNVPLIYIVTVGGVFGVLPFIDFVLILLSKDINKTYTGNQHLFMWQKK